MGTVVSVPGRARSLPGRAGDLLAIGVLVGVVAVLGALLIRHNSTFSRIDELDHFSYVTSLVDRHRLPVGDDLYTQQAIRAEACWGHQLHLKLPPCDSPTLDPHDFGAAGKSATNGYPPVYYVATAIVAVPVRAIAGADTLFVPSRVASLLWLVLGGIAAFALGRTVGASRVASLAVALLSALGPMMLAQGTTVNPDALSLLAGAGTGLAWLRWRRTPGTRGFLALLAVLTADCLVKGNFLTIPLAVVVAELAVTAQAGPWLLLRPGTWSPRRPLGRVTVAVAVAELGGLAWSYLLLVAGQSVGGDSAAAVIGRSQPGGSPWQLDRLLHYAPGSFAPLGGSPFFVSVLNPGVFALLGALVNLLVFAGAVAAVLLARGRWAPEAGTDIHPGRAVGYLAASSFLLAAPVVAVLTGLTGAFVAYPPRYSLFVVPLGLVALLGLSGRRRAGLLAVLAALLVLAESWYLSV